MMPPDGEFGQGGPRGPQAPALGPVPSGAFDPVAWTQGDVKTFQHDETVQPGKIYRYRARYVLMSPIYQQPAAAGTADLLNQFKWASAWSDWTATVTVPSRVSFFVASNITTNASSVQFEIFRYVSGQMRSKTYAVTPGDPIGTQESVADFTTGHVLVDIRRDARGGSYALVMTPDGTLIKRDVSDSKSDLYVDFKNQASASTATP